MTDTARVRELIKESGYKLQYVAECLGITRYALALKLENKNEFKSTEISMLCKILGINSLKQKEKLFFAQNVD